VTRFVNHLPTDLQNWALIVSTHWNEAHGIVHFVATIFGIHCH
jgi:hypothetical protein